MGRYGLTEFEWHQSRLPNNNSRRNLRIEERDLVLNSADRRAYVAFSQQIADTRFAMDICHRFLRYRASPESYNLTPTSLIGRNVTYRPIPGSELSAVGYQEWLGSLRNEFLQNSGVRYDAYLRKFNALIKSDIWCIYIDCIDGVRGARDNAVRMIEKLEMSNEYKSPDRDRFPASAFYANRGGPAYIADYRRELGIISRRPPVIPQAGRDIRAPTHTPTAAVVNHPERPHVIISPAIQNASLRPIPASDSSQARIASSGQGARTSANGNTNKETHTNELVSAKANTNNTKSPSPEPEDEDSDIEVLPPEPKPPVPTVDLTDDNQPEDNPEPFVKIETPVLASNGQFEIQRKFTRASDTSANPIGRFFLYQAKDFSDGDGPGRETAAAAVVDPRISIPSPAAPIPQEVTGSSCIQNESTSLFPSNCTEVSQTELEDISSDSEGTSGVPEANVRAENIQPEENTRVSSSPSSTRGIIDAHAKQGQLSVYQILFGCPASDEVIEPANVGASRAEENLSGSNTRVIEMSESESEEVIEDFRTPENPSQKQNNSPFSDISEASDMDVNGPDKTVPQLKQHVTSTSVRLHTQSLSDISSPSETEEPCRTVPQVSGQPTTSEKCVPSENSSVTDLVVLETQAPVAKKVVYNYHHKLSTARIEIELDNSASTETHKSPSNPGLLLNPCATGLATLGNGGLSASAPTDPRLSGRTTLYQNVAITSARPNEARIVEREEYEHSSHSVVSGSRGAGNPIFWALDNLPPPVPPPAPLQPPASFPSNAFSTVGSVFPVIPPVMRAHQGPSLTASGFEVPRPDKPLPNSQELRDQLTQPVPSHLSRAGDVLATLENAEAIRPPCITDGILNIPKITEPSLSLDFTRRQEEMRFNHTDLSNSTTPNFANLSETRSSRPNAHDERMNRGHIPYQNPERRSQTRWSSSHQTETERERIEPYRKHHREPSRSRDERRDSQRHDSARRVHENDRRVPSSDEISARPQAPASSAQVQNNSLNLRQSPPNNMLDSSHQRNVPRTPVRHLTGITPLPNSLPSAQSPPQNVPESSQHRDVTRTPTRHLSGSTPSSNSLNLGQSTLNNIPESSRHQRKVPHSSVRDLADTTPPFFNADCDAPAPPLKKSKANPDKDKDIPVTSKTIVNARRIPKGQDINILPNVPVSQCGVRTSRPSRLLATRRSSGGPSIEDGIPVSNSAQSNQIIQSSESEIQPIVPRDDTTVMSERRNVEGGLAKPAENLNTSTVESTVAQSLKKQAFSTKGAKNTTVLPSGNQPYSPSVKRAAPSIKKPAPLSVKLSAAPSGKVAPPVSGKAAAPPSGKPTVPPSTKSTPPLIMKPAPLSVKLLAAPSRKAAAKPSGKAAAPPSVKAAAPPSGKAAAPPIVKPAPLSVKLSAAPLSGRASAPPSAKLSAAPSGETSAPPSVKSTVPPREKLTPPIVKPTPLSVKLSAAPSGNPAAPSNEKPAPLSGRASAPPSGEASGPPSVKLSAAPSGEASAPPSVKLSAAPSGEASAPPSVKSTAPLSEKPIAPPNVKPTPLSVKLSTTPSGNLAAPLSVGESAPPSGEASASPSVKSTAPLSEKPIVPPNEKSTVPSNVKSTVPQREKPTAPPVVKPTPLSVKLSATPSGNPAAPLSVRESAPPSGEASAAPSGKASAPLSEKPAVPPVPEHFALSVLGDHSEPSDKVPPKVNSVQPETSSVVANIGGATTEANDVLTRSVQVVLRRPSTETNTAAPSSEVARSTETSAIVSAVGTTAVEEPSSSDSDYEDVDDESGGDTTLTSSDSSPEKRPRIIKRMTPINRALLKFYRRIRLVKRKLAVMVKFGIVEDASPFKECLKEVYETWDASDYEVECICGTPVDQSTLTLSAEGITDYFLVLLDMLDYKKEVRAFLKRDSLLYNQVVDRLVRLLRFFTHEKYENQNPEQFILNISQTIDRRIMTGELTSKLASDATRVADAWLEISNYKVHNEHDFSTDDFQKGPQGFASKLACIKKNFESRKQRVLKREQERMARRVKIEPQEVDEVME